MKKLMYLAAIVLCAGVANATIIVPASVSYTGTVVFEFDLGSATTVGTFALWGYHFGSNNDNSIANVTLDFSINGGTNIDSSQTIDVPYPASWDLATVVPLTPASDLGLDRPRGHPYLLPQEETKS